MAEATIERRVLSPIDKLCLRSAMEGNAANVSACLQRGADIARFNRHGFLCMVAARGHVDAIRVLLDAGADVNATSTDGRTTPLMTAAAQGKTDALALLLERGATLPKNPQEQYRLLWWATSSHNAEALRFLVEHGVEVDSRLKDGETILMSAVSRGLTDMVTALIEAGADVNAISLRRMTALRYARLNGRKEIIALLQQARAQDIPLTVGEHLWDKTRAPVSRTLYGLMARLRTPDV